MRTGSVIGCLLVIAIGLGAMALPEISVDQPEYNFGSIGIGYMVKHTFVLQNSGDQVLDIVRIRASCGCTTTELPTNLLSPGDSVSLEVLVLADHGTVKNVSIYVYTNAPDIYGVANSDREDPDITLKVRGDLTPKPDNALAAFEMAYDYMILLDVRDAASYAANHLIGAINVPVQQLPASLAGLPKGALLIVHDLAGEAADAAVQSLLNAGYMSAYYLQGGLSRWVAVQGDRYFVKAAPLPVTSGNATGGGSGRPYSQMQFRTDFYTLIDVRDAAAYQAGHLAGAINIPPAQLGGWISRLPQEKTVIIYDDDGGALSQAAYQTLSNAGFARAYILLGGLDEWVYQYGSAYITRI